MCFKEAVWLLPNPNKPRKWIIDLINEKTHRVNSYHGNELCLLTGFDKTAIQINKLQMHKEGIGSSKLDNF